MDSTCHDGACSKCWAGKFVITGIIVLVTAMYWPMYIWHVLGILLIVKGIMKWSMPGCGHCQSSMPAKKAKK